jgi:hypothetical protein
VSNIAPKEYKEPARAAANAKGCLPAASASQYSLCAASAKGAEIRCRLVFQSRANKRGGKKRRDFNRKTQITFCASVLNLLVYRSPYRTSTAKFALGEKQIKVQHTYLLFDMASTFKVVYLYVRLKSK